MAFTEELERQLSAEAREAVENGARSSYLQGIIRDKEKDCTELCTSEYIHFLTSPSGPLLGYPLLGVSSLIQRVTVEAGTSPAMVSACVSRCMLKVNRIGFLLYTHV